MKTSLLLSSLLALSLLACEKKETAQTQGANNTPAAQETTQAQEVKTFNAVCPISGEKVAADGGGMIEYKGKKIGFCCPGCVDKFNADPEKALKNLSPDGQKWVSSEPGQM